VASPAIQADFGLADSQIGFLSGAFVVVYGLAAPRPAIGSIASAGEALLRSASDCGSLCTVFTGFAYSYSQMFLAHTAFGIGEAITVRAGVPVEIRERPRKSAQVRSWRSDGPLRPLTCGEMRGKSPVKVTMKVDHTGRSAAVGIDL
jgi:hypothetical protein